MVRPRAPELTERELEIMQVLWQHADMTAADVRDELALAGKHLAYTTVATLIRILADKGFVQRTNDARPFRYRPRRSFEEVSGRLLGHMLEKVFGGSAEALLVRLFENCTLTKQERALLREILKEQLP